MTIVLPIGITSFKEIRQNGAYYVDKTMFLQDLLGARVKVTLITRPRRFGKSLMLSTLDEFFSNRNSREKAEKLFDGLAIMEQKAIVEAHMGQYPVMHFSFNGVDGADYDSLMNNILRAMQKWCRRNRSLFDFDKCDQYDVELFDRIRKGTSNEKYKEPENGKLLMQSDMESFLDTMISMLVDTYGKKVVVLLDEYDVPLAKASLFKGMVKVGEELLTPYDAMKKFIASLFGPALKDNNEYLERAVVTGCMRIAQASIFTGINNFSWYGIQRYQYSEAFGFTPQEVKKLLYDAGIPERESDFREWYDGYVFGNAEIYCPWDVLEQAAHLIGHPGGNMEPHWLGTSGNEILRMMLSNPKMNIEEEISGLLEGGSVTTVVNRNVTYDILQGDRDNLWTVLYQTGYLTKEYKEEEGSAISLKIPNREVKLAYKDNIIKWMVDKSDKSQASEIIEALLTHNAEKAAELLSKHLLESMSYFNYSEDFYHGFIGAYLKEGGWQLATDREYGTGRPDIVLHNAIKTKAIVIEVKHAKEEKELVPSLREAVGQCIREKYIEGVKTEFESVVCYGLACFEKQCIVKEVKETDRMPQKQARKSRTTRKTKKTKSVLME